MRNATLATLAFLAVTMPAQAGVIEQACLNSGRNAASPQLCGCIQQVADLTLQGSEQRKAARFFRDPHQAQEVRQSSRTSDRQFWDRYRAFGAAAETYCS
jgi:hypothetical protein